MGVNRHVGYSSHKSHSAVTCAYCIFIYFVQLDVLGVTRSRRGSFHPARWKLHGVSLVLEKKESGLHPMTPVRIPPTHLLVRPPISAQSEAESRPDITMADPCSRCPFIRYPRRTKYIQLTQNAKDQQAFRASACAETSLNAALLHTLYKTAPRRHLPCCIAAP